MRPERFELPASWFVARRSIQLSYGRALNEITAIHGGEGGITQALRAFAPSGPLFGRYPRFVPSPLTDPNRPKFTQRMAEREGLLVAPLLTPSGPPFGRYPRFVALASG